MAFTKDIEVTSMSRKRKNEIAVKRDNKFLKHDFSSCDLYKKGQMNLFLEYSCGGLTKMFDVESVTLKS